MAGMTCWRSGQRKRGLGLAGVAGSLGIEESLIGKPCQVLLESYLPVLYHLGIDSQTLSLLPAPVPGPPQVIREQPAGATFVNAFVKGANSRDRWPIVEGGEPKRKKKLKNCARFGPGHPFSL